MPHSLFISDLHLCATRPEITQDFIRFLDETATHAEALYILGDLFEYWAGDDDLQNPVSRLVIHALQALHKKNVNIYFMHGNRDFLIANQFAAAAELTLLSDPTVIDLYGTSTLLMHGDTLCTDDLPYLEFRNVVRDPQWQANFLAQPLAMRHKIVQGMRARSESEKSEKSTEIMDVNEQAVIETFKRFGVTRLIHGHTHRPALHTYEMGGKRLERWVLADWYEEGGYLFCEKHGCRQIKVRQ